MTRSWPSSSVRASRRGREAACPPVPTSGAWRSRRVLRQEWLRLECRLRGVRSAREVRREGRTEVLLLVVQENRSDELRLLLRLIIRSCARVSSPFPCRTTSQRTRTDFQIPFLGTYPLPAACALVRRSSALQVKGDGVPGGGRGAVLLYEGPEAEVFEGGPGDCPGGSQQRSGMRGSWRPHRRRGRRGRGRGRSSSPS